MKKFGNKIRRILHVDDESFSVSLRFSDGAGGVVSLAHLFERPKGLAADILKGGMFMSKGTLSAGSYDRLQTSEVGRARPAATRSLSHSTDNGRRAEPALQHLGSPHLAKKGKGRAKNGRLEPP
jgi:hypothetical protein